jgi:N-acetylmuramoyl-L-alanine amidase
MVAAVLLPTVSAFVSASAGPITLIINGRVIPTDVPPMLVADRTLVPIRVVSEHLGAVVEWHDSTRTVTIVSGVSRIVLTEGQARATIDGQPIILDVAARLVSNRIMVPIRFVSEALGAQVEWVAAKRQVVVTYTRVSPVVRQVSWAESPGAARFVFVTSGPAAYSVKTLARSGAYPDRILVDVEKADLELPAEVIVGVAGVERIRSFTQETDRGRLARIVLDTTEPLSFRAWATWEPGAPALQPGDLPADLSGGLGAIVIDIQYKVLGVEYVGEPGSERVVIRLNGPAEHNLWEATNPWRIVVDLRGVTLSSSLTQRTIPVGQAGVSQIRVAQFQVNPDVARVVLDTDRSFPYTLIHEGDSIVIYLGGASVVTGFGYASTDRGGRFTVSADRPLVGSVERLAYPDRLVLTVHGARFGGQFTGGGTFQVGDSLVQSVRYEESSQYRTVTFTFLLAAPGVGAGAPVATASGLTLDVLRSALAGKIIVIDPGHGGNDPGAIAPNGLREATLTHSIADILIEKLRAAGASVYRTCLANENPDKYDRAAVGNAVGADVFVSIHFNANNRAGVCGTEVYYSDTHPDSQRLSEIILRHLVGRLGRPNGGTRYMPAFPVVREPRMPSCLIETLYMTNPDDLALIMDPGTKEKIAQAVFDGLREFFSSP